MANPIAALKVAMSANSAQFERDMKKAKNAVKKNATGMQRAMAGAKKGFDLTLKSIKVMGVAAIAGGAIIAKMVKSSIDFADSAQKTAEGIGTTVEELTALKHAADLSGVSFEGLQKGMKAITKRSSDAAAGMKEYQEVFDLLEIDVLNLDGTLKSSSDLILEVADKFVTFKDSAAKTALALELFGKSGADLIPLLNAGSKGIKSMTDEARELGIVITKEVAEGAERFNDNLTRVGTVSSAFGLILSKELLPVLETYTADMVEAVKETDNLGKTRLENWAESMVTSIDIVVQALNVLVLGYNATQLGIRKFIRGADRSFKAWALSMGGYSEQANEALTGALDSEGLNKSIDNYSEKAEKSMVKLFERLAGVRRKIFTPTPEEPTKDAPVLTPDVVTKVTEAEKAKLAAQREGIATTRALRDETEIYNDEMLRLFKLFNAGHISLETYNRGMTKAGEVLKSATEEVDDADDKFSELTMTINGWARDSADAIVEFATEGKDSFSDMIDSMLKDLLRMAVTKSITEPIFKMFGGVLSGGIGSVFGGRAVGGSVSSGGLYEVNERRPEIFNLGGREFLSTASQNGRVIPNNDGAGSGLTISVPVTVAQRNPAMQAELRQEIEYTVENVIRRHA